MNQGKKDQTGNYTYNGFIVPIPGPVASIVTKEKRHMILTLLLGRCTCLRLQYEKAQKERSPTATKIHNIISE